MDAAPSEGRLSDWRADLLTQGARVGGASKDPPRPFHPFCLRTQAYASIYFFQRMTLHEKLEEHSGSSLFFLSCRSSVCRRTLD